MMIFSFATMFIFLLGCNQPADVNALLKNAESRDNLYSAILDDHELTMELMEKMMSNDHAKMMMMNSKEMMKMMMGNKEMMKMMGQDGDAMAQMMEGMMGNHQMMG